MDIAPCGLSLPPYLAAVPVQWHLEKKICLHVWTSSFLPLSLSACHLQSITLYISLSFCEENWKQMQSSKACSGHLKLCKFTSAVLKSDIYSALVSPIRLSHSVCLLSSLKLCQINLEGKTFYSKKDKPLCKGHAFAPVWESEVHLQKKEHCSLPSLYPLTLP